MSLVVVAALAAFLLGGARMFFGDDGHGDHDHGDHDLAAVGEVIDVDGALLRVEMVRPEIMAAMRMPAGMMPDMVPDGYRRFSIDVTVMASTPAGFDPEPDMFSVYGEGLGSTQPHRAVADPEWMPEGNRGFVSLLFQTPLGVEPLFLEIEGTEMHVQLEGDLGQGHSHDDDIGNDIVLTGYFEAEMEDYSFVPSSLIVGAGTEVAFHNHDAVVHNATADDGSWGTRDIPGDQTSGAVTFEDPGSYSFYCSIHPSMTGIINVVATG
jgi:plastocyanin